jgi:hypothetical protein
MKHAALIGLMVCSAFTIGCGSGSSAQTIKPPKGHEKRGTAVALAPEDAITKLETSEERVTYLHQLKNDPTFEPKKHTELLQKYAGDADPDVATAAKELLDGTK